MSAAQVAPTIPPRPARAQQAAAAQGVSKLPDIPPRPINKRLDRSVSPANYPRSPLNEPWNANLTRQKTNEKASEALPRRPSVQNLPSIGQEGMEYGDLLDSQTSNQPLSSSLAADAAAQTRNIAQDLKLYAPKPSLPKSSATAQVQAVTRTDSGQAASHGLGLPLTPSQDEDHNLRQVRTRSISSRPGSTVSGERRPSIFDETGPAELGLRVPINPLLGDVQAPSPAPGLSPYHTGSNGEKKRPHHNRTKSGREIFTPPGSYGLHGHGIVPETRFEKDWYARHPEAAQLEETTGHGVYESIGSGRGAYALSSDDLNKIVRQTASRGAGFGTSETTYSFPDEQIGYAASEVYVARSQQNTPNSLAKTVTNTSQPTLESPLRKSSFPADESTPAEVRRGRLSMSSKNDDHDAVESEHEGDIQVQARRKYNKITGGEETMNETTQPSEQADYYVEHGYSVPILAADEVAKQEGAEHLQPAVSPKQERRSSVYELEPGSGDVTPTSRPSSRPTSVYGLHSASHSLSRFVSHHDDRENLYTPLEDVHEYEPLFPEDDGKERPISHAERFKPRPNALKQRFPSQDIWEDTPSSALYSATVSTPDLPAQVQKPSEAFESPEKEAARKQEPSEEERRKLIPAEERLAKSRFAPHLRDDMPTRPGMVPRFPSSDIWEDSPESHHLVTTVSNAQIDPDAESPVEVQSKPNIPARPVGKSRLGEGASSAQVAPGVPARPHKNVRAVPPNGAQLTDTTAPKSSSSSPTELKKVPSIPDRPKPQVPVRPGKKPADGLSKTLSGDSAGPAEQEKVSPPLTKVKPQIPARPGNKIASLRGNFMNDLNAKLGLGPPKEKEKEPEPVVEEAKPLEDARKGRARGPVRRAPAKSPAAAPVKSFGFSMLTPRSLWTIDDVDELSVTTREPVGLSSNSDKAPAATRISEEKPEPVETSTETASSLPATTETTDYTEKKIDIEPLPSATQLATDTSDELADPDLETPMVERSNPLSTKQSVEEIREDDAKTVDDGEDDLERDLSQRTTASDTQPPGDELEREETDPNADAIPASQQTTASSQAETAPLEKVTTHEPTSVADAAPDAEGDEEGLRVGKTE